PQPAAGPASGIGVLFHAGDPATALDAPDLNAIVYWIVAGVLLVGLALAGAWAWVLLRRHSRKPRPTRTPPPVPRPGTRSPRPPPRRRCSNAPAASAPRWTSPPPPMSDTGWARAGAGKSGRP